MLPPIIFLNGGLWWANRPDQVYDEIHAGSKTPGRRGFDKIGWKEPLTQNTEGFIGKYQLDLVGASGQKKI